MWVICGSYHENAFFSKTVHIRKQFIYCAEVHLMNISAVTIRCQLIHFINEDNCWSILFSLLKHCRDIFLRGINPTAL